MVPMMTWYVARANFFMEALTPPIKQRSKGMNGLIHVSHNPINHGLVHFLSGVT